MPYKSLTYDKKEHIVRLTLNRPRTGNTLNLELANELVDACRAVNQDDEVRAVILTGAGESFCTGFDLAELRQGVNPASLSSNAIAGINCPIITAVNGDALGAGLELVLSCDIRICSDNARFGFPETSCGLIPGGGGTQRLPRIVGKGKATEMILTAELVDAAEAYRVGLVSKVVPAQKLHDDAEEIARKLIAKAPIAVRYAKEAVNKGMDLTLGQGLRLEADLSFLLQTTKDRAEGIRAFIEKRKATFKGE
ncbi:MAG: hypothetical protein FJ004_02745 [Chloroflexi bacterium]|nr:hypothetical protein [Chloroflexota bacterium]